MSRISVDAQNRKHQSLFTPCYDTSIRCGFCRRLKNEKLLKLQNPTNFALKDHGRLGDRLLNRVVNYLILHASFLFRNLFSWQQLRPVVVLSYAVAFATANAQTKAPSSSVSAQTDKQFNKEGVTSGDGTGKLLSFNFTVDSGKLSPAQCNAQTLSDGTDLCLMGYFSPAGKVSDLNIPWFATLDEQGKIRWAGRLGLERPKVRAEITYRGNQLLGFCPTGENQVLVANFVAESMTAGKAAQLELAPLLNGPIIELPGIAPLPPVVTIVQDNGASFAMTVVSQDVTIALNKIYSVPAFASQSKNPIGNPSRGRVFPLPDGSGYCLAISDIQRSGKFGSAGEKRLGLVRVDKTGNLVWAKLYHFKGASGLPLIGKVAIDGSMLAIPGIGSPSPSLVARISPDGRKLWAKNTDAPNLAFDDFHCDGTPYRFIKPNLLSLGLTVASTRLPAAVILAQDYETGKILYQTRYPGDFTGGAGICPATGDSIYISTLGIQMSMRTNASIARFDQQLRLIAAKEIIGAESSFPILFQRASNQNLLSYYFHKTQRGEAAALDDNLQPTDTPCPWIKDLRLAMAQSSYTATDADSSEENLEVILAPGGSQIQASELKLEPLNLNVTLEGAQKRAER